MHRRTLIRGAFASAVAGFANSKSLAADPPSDAQIERYRTLVKTGIAKNKLTGVSVALVKNGTLAWAEGFGLADRERGLAMTPNTIVGIGSVTKTFTALALMQLQTQGRIDIDRPVTTYVPRLHIGTRGADLAQVTVRSIMNHTSGLPSDVFKNTGLESGDYTGVVDLLNETQLAAWPQTIGLYSNIGYSVLGNVIHNVSGQAYPDYVKAHILRPLGMVRSGFVTDASLPLRTQLYYQDGRRTPPLELRDQPAGGLYADAKDMARYAIALMAAWQGRSGLPMNPASVQAMFRLSNASIRVETNKKGLGWFMFQAGDAFAMYHAGSTGFANAALLLLPQKQTAAVILVNTVGGNVLANDFAFRVLEDNGLKTADIRPSPHLPYANENAVPTTLSPTLLDSHVGNYVRKRTFASITRDGNDLLLKKPDGPLRLQSLSDGSFRPFAQADRDKMKPIAGERYRFADVGPYHVLFVQSAEDGEYQAGYRIQSTLPNDTWKTRLGRYEHFGYQIPGAEQILAAQFNLIDGGLLQMQLVYNSGTYTYPLIPVASDQAITGGLGPETTGETVRFFDQDGIASYSGLTFRRLRTSMKIPPERSKRNDLASAHSIRGSS